MTVTSKGLGHNSIVVQHSEPSILHQLRSLCCKYPFNLYIWVQIAHQYLFLFQEATTEDDVEFEEEEELTEEA